MNETGFVSIKDRRSDPFPFSSMGYGIHRALCSSFGFLPSCLSSSGFSWGGGGRNLAALEGRSSPERRELVRPSLPSATRPTSCATSRAGPGRHIFTAWRRANGRELPGRSARGADAVAHIRMCRAEIVYAFFFSVRFPVQQPSPSDCMPFRRSSSLTSTSAILCSVA